MINVLMIGDVFAGAGRRALMALLPGLKRRHAIDLTVANGENAAGGLGLSAKLAHEMFVLGIDVITTGNHVWKKKDLYPLLEDEPHLLRPANYPPEAPGKGWVKVNVAGGIPLGVINLEGRVFMNPLPSPFAMVDEILAGPLAGVDAVVVDFHAEATSEKQAMGWYLDGRVSAVVGTHTHVQTADARVLPGGTAYITDLGLTGPTDSVIGMDPESALKRLTTFVAGRFTPAKGPAALNGAVIHIDEATGRAEGIEPLAVPAPEEED